MSTPGEHDQERLEHEQAASATVKKTLWWVIGIMGAIAFLVVIAVVVVVAVLAGGDGEGDVAERADGPGPASLARVARASGCEYRTFADEGTAHVQKRLTSADFGTNPPTSGDHNDEAAQDGIYAPGDEPDIENWVHTLEHGRILLQYRPGAPREAVDALAALFDEPVAGGDPAYHTVLMRNNTEMPFEVAAVAWRQYMACPAYTPGSIEALRAFRDARVDKAPELIP